MSSAVFSTSAATGRPFFLTGCAEQSSTISRWQHLQSSINHSKIPPSSITPASQLQIRPAPEMVSSGIPALDALTGGLPRGCLTEICGTASSGRTTLLLAALAAATRRGEFCAVVDASDALDPHSAAAAGVDLERLLWVRCEADPPQKHRRTEKNFSRIHSALPKTKQRLEKVLLATDSLLESGGFGLIVLDLADLPSQEARRIPLTTWFRFRRAIEHTPTMLLSIEQQAIAGSCSSLLLQLGAAKRQNNAAHGASCGSDGENDAAPKGRKKICPGDLQFTEPAHVQLLTGLNIRAELIRTRLERKPAGSITFSTKTAWVG